MSTVERERLAHELRSHNAGIGAFINSVIAAHALGSPAGQAVDDHRFHDTGAVVEVLADERKPGPAPEPTESATRMNSTGIMRGDRRRVTMPPATCAAVVAYITERVSLLERARELVPESRVIAWHAKRAQRLRELLGGGAS